ETNSTLVISNLTRADAAYYTVLVSNIVGSVTSEPAYLRVIIPQRIQLNKISGENSIKLTFCDTDGGLLSSEDLAYFEIQSSTNLIDWITLTNLPTLIEGKAVIEEKIQNDNSVNFFRIISK
ncbi:MAG: immunoglobulin domain-containing protein, partial [Limisphaerales bacterium]